MARLGDVFPLIRNGVSIKQIDGAGGLPITRIETIANRVVDRSRMGYANIIDNDRYAEYQLQDGDILMSHINSEKHLGKVARYKSNANEYIIHGMNLLVLRVDRQIMMSEYAEYFFNSDSFLRQIPNITKKSVNQASFNISSLRELFIPIPQLDQQREVVHILDGVCALISLRKQQLAKLDELVKSQFVELFGDPMDNPLGWDRVNISAVVGGKVGNGFFAKRDDYCDDGNVKVLGVAHVVNRMYSNTEDLPKTNGTETDVIKYGVKYGDMLFCRSSLVAAGIGKASIVPKGTPSNVLFECHVIRLPLDLDKCVPEFMQVMSTTDYYRNQVIAQSKTATMTTIGQDGILKTEIILPPLALQKKFLQFVEQTNKSKLSIQQSITQIETLKASLMLKYFG